MSAWNVRSERAPRSVPYPSAQAVMDAVRDGLIAATDEVRAPGDRAWRPIDDHPAFAEALAELEPGNDPGEDDTHLDMNPMIDVSLVLLIFFILTATYATLSRSIDLPPEPPEEQKQAATVSKKDVLERAFQVTVRMDGDNPVVRVENKVVPLAELQVEMTQLVKFGGKKEAFIDVSNDVLWGVEVKVFEAARQAEVQRIHWPKGK